MISNEVPTNVLLQALKSIASHPPANDAILHELKSKHQRIERFPTRFEDARPLLDKAIDAV